MAEAVYAALEYIGSALGTEMTFTAGELYAISQAIVVGASVYTMREQQRRAANAQRAAYEASLKDRYVMVRSATEARQIVLGRQRVSGPIAYIGSYGSNREHLVFTVILASHEIDAVETVYFDDEQVTLDSGGNVVSVNRRDLFTLTTTGDTFTLTSEPAAGTVTATVAYGTTIVTLGVSVSGSAVTVTGGTSGSTGTVTITYQPASSPWVVAAAADDNTTMTTDGAGSGSVTLSVTPVAGSVKVFPTPVSIAATDADAPLQDLTSYASVSGATVTVTACPVLSGSLTVQYRDGTVTSRARVKAYLGASGQSADADMISALPGVWTSAHTMAGLAYLRVELDYDPNAFPSGIPNVSAVVRGAKLYDPRTTTTTWSQNPALMMRYVACSSLLGRLGTSAINDTAISTAATICDGSASYVLNGQTYTRALYTAGLVAKSDMRAQDVLTDLAKAMAGRWVFMDGQMFVKAGAYVTPLQSLDETWLAGGQAVQVQPKAARGDVINVASGKFADETRDYIITDYPRVTASSYVTEDGAELPIDIQLNAVTFSGQAQQVVAAQMRDARQGLRVILTCNMRAFSTRVFDTLSVTLGRFGWSSKVFEVLDVSWTIDGGIQLTLKETSSSIWALGSSFSATDPAPNTLFPSPYKVPAITSLSAASGSGQLLKQADGTVMTRVQVSWTAVTDAFVNESLGGVEVRYGLATAPETAWQSVYAPSGQSTCFLTENLRDGQLYLIKARAYNALVRGAWCLPIVHQVVGKTGAPSDVAGLAGTINNGRIVWSWTACTDLDYNVTEARLGGTDWASATTPPAFKGTANTFSQVVTAAGTYTVRVRHIDSSGNLSASTVSASVTVAASDLLQAFYALAVTVYQQASSAPAAPAGGSYTFTGDVFTAPSGWSRSLPTGSTTPTWASVYLFETTTPAVAVSGPAGTGDPFYASVSLLAHFDGANNSTTFTDSGPSPKTLSAVGSAKLSTAQQKWGTAALTLNGTTDYLSTPDGADFQFGTGDFTIECWVYPTAFQSSAFGGGILSKRATTGAAGDWSLLTSTSGSGPVSFQQLTTGSFNNFTLTSTLSLNTWTHLAFSRVSGVLYGFFNGNLQVTAALTASLNGGTNALNIGRNTSSGLWVGYIDDVRITKGAGRYTSTFAPPAAAFPDAYGVGGWPTPVKLVQDGAAGSVLTLGYTSQVFTYDGTGTASPSSQTITFTANLSGLSGTATFTCTLYNSAGSSLGTVTLGGSGNTRTLTNTQFASLGSATTAVVVASLSGYSDQATIVKLQAGSAGANAVVGFLTNEAASVAADSSGTVSSFSGTGGTFAVFDGLADKTGNAAVTYSVNASSGLTISIASTGVYTVTAMSADTGTATLRAVYSGLTIDKIYSLAKSKTGSTGSTGSAGANAPLLTLMPTALAFTFDTTNTAAPSSQTISFTAQLANLAGTATFVATMYDASGSSLGTATMGGSGNTRTLTNAQFGAAQYAVVSATLTSYSDQVTVARVRDGSSAVALSLTATSVTVAADSTGYVASYSLATTTAKVMVGATDDTANWTISKTDGAGVTSSLSGTQVNVTAMSGFSGYVTISASRTGYATQTTRFSIAKALSAGTTSGPVTGLNLVSIALVNGSSAAVGVRFNSDGTIDTKDSGGTYGADGNWYAPTTSGIGATPGYWIKVHQVDGPTVSGATLDTVLALSTAREWTYSVSGTGQAKTGDFSFTIYSDSGGTTTVATGTFGLDAETAPFP